MPDLEEPIFVVDLTDGEMERCASAVAQADRGWGSDRRLPDPPSRPIRWLALVIEGRDDPVLLPLEPTRDVEFLDALARIIRIAVLAGERIPTVAIEYGTELERSLAFERCLPSWAYDGVAPDISARLPRHLRKVLESRISRPPRPRRPS